MNFDTLEKANILRNKIDCLERELRTFIEYENYTPRHLPSQLEIEAKAKTSNKENNDLHRDFRFDVPLNLLSSWVSDLRKFKETELVCLKREFENL